MENYISIVPKEECIVHSRVYIGHPMTDLKEMLSDDEYVEAIEFIEDVACLTKRFGFKPILPAMFGSSINKKLISAEQIYNDCSYAVRSSVLFIAIPIVPSIGLGAELQIAKSNNIPVLLLVNNKTGLSKMIEGMNSFVLKYSDYKNCLHLIHRHLSEKNYNQSFSYYSFEKL